MAVNRRRPAHTMPEVISMNSALERDFPDLLYRRQNQHVLYGFLPRYSPYVTDAVLESVFDQPPN